MQKKILYLGNKTADFSNNKSVIDSLVPLFSKFSKVYSASGKKNKLYRFLDMNYYFFKYGVFSDKIIIDVYSTFAFFYAFYFSILSFVFGKPYILFLHGGNLPNRFAKQPYLFFFIFRKAHEIIAPSDYLAQFFKKRGFNVKVISNFIFIQDYPFLERNLVRPTIFSMRGLSSLYNPFMTLKAIQYLKSKYPDIFLLMLGDDTDELYQEAIDFIKSNNLECHIKIAPKLPKSEWIIESKNFDIMVSNPIIDNTPTSLIEGMALGMCVISTNVGGIPFLFESKEIVLVSNNDFKELASAIDLLIFDSLKANSLSINGRSKAEKFDWDLIKNNWFYTLGINDEK